MLLSSRQKLAQTEMMRQNRRWNFVNTNDVCSSVREVSTLVRATVINGSKSDREIRVIVEGISTYSYKTIGPRWVEICASNSSQNQHVDTSSSSKSSQILHILVSTYELGRIPKQRPYEVSSVGDTMNDRRTVDVNGFT
ncbi:hypothetical protein U1Q18_050862 [Sarracenia purpurea var. burkii]